MKNDPTNPQHYKMGAIEVADFLDAWNLDHHSASAIEYVCRAPFKGNEIQDLEKAIWRLNRRLRVLRDRNAAMTPEERDRATLEAVRASERAGRPILWTCTKHIKLSHEVALGENCPAGMSVCKDNIRVVANIKDPVKCYFCHYKIEKWDDWMAVYHSPPPLRFD